MPLIAASQVRTYLAAAKEVQATTPLVVISHSVTIPSDRQRWGLVLPFINSGKHGERHNEMFGKEVSLDYAKVNEFAKGIERV